MDNNGRANKYDDYLVTLHEGQWYGWTKAKEKTAENLIIHDSSKSKPTQKELDDGLAALQKAYDDSETKQTTDETSGKTKLKNLGLTNDEIKALTGK